MGFFNTAYAPLLYSQHLQSSRRDQKIVKSIAYVGKSSVQTIIQ